MAMLDQVEYNTIYETLFLMQLLQQKIGTKLSSVKKLVHSTAPITGTVLLILYKFLINHLVSQPFK